MNVSAKLVLCVVPPPTGVPGTITIERACVAVALTESVALTVKLLVPDTVGIPDIIPPDERVSPAGSDPADIVQV
jgi:hypothetical protein